MQSTAMKKEYAKIKKVAHPNSRKCIAIAKRTKKISNREKAKMSGLIKQNLVGEKMLWLRDHIDKDVSPYTPELTARLLQKYITRHAEEMEQINIKRSIGTKRSRQHASREDIIRMTKEREQEEFDTCGIEIPDILNARQLQMLREWNGELKYITNFKFRRFGRKHLNDALQRAKKLQKERTNEVEVKTSGKVEDQSEEVPENLPERSEENSTISEPTASSEESQSKEAVMEVE